MTKQHTREFKQVVSGFGIGFSTPARWMQLERQISPEPMARSDLEKEFANLRKEIRLLREERGELKRRSDIYHFNAHVARLRRIL